MVRSQRPSHLFLAFVLLLSFRISLRAGDTWPVLRSPAHEPNPYRFDPAEIQRPPKEFLEDSAACVLPSFSVALDRFRVCLPKNKPFHHATVGGELAPECRDDGDFRTYTWQAHNCRQGPRDENLPSREQLFFSVACSPFASWEQACLLPPGASPSRLRQPSAGQDGAGRGGDGSTVGRGCLPRAVG